jgi:hypothetical protein
MPISVWHKKLAAPGDVPRGILDWKGPTSYTVVTPGTTPTGGDQIPASLLGVNQILLVLGQGSQTGYFRVVPIRLSNTKWTLQWIAMYTGTVGGQSQTINTQAVAASDLSGQIVRLEVVTLSA